MENGFITVNKHDRSSDISQNVNTVSTIDQIINKYQEVFTGLGKIGSRCKIEMDATMRPVIHAPRRVPFSYQQLLRDKLEEMENQGVITKVTSPTD